MVSKLQTILLSLILLSSLAQAEDSKINRYSADFSVNVNGQKQNLNVILGFKASKQPICDQNQQPKGCCDLKEFPKGCYLGWVQEYNTSRTQQVVRGIEQEIRPVFTLSGVNSDDYTLNFRKKLGQQWAQLIYIWAEKSNVFAEKKQGIVFEPKREIRLQGTQYLRSDFTRRVNYQKDYLSSQEDSYNLILPTDNQIEKDRQDDAQNDLLCNVRTLIRLNDTIDDPQKILQARKFLADGQITKITKAQIQKNRQNPVINQINRDDFANNVANDPKIDLTEIDDKVQGQSIDINPDDLFKNPQKYKFLERRSVDIESTAATNESNRTLQSGITHVLLSKTYPVFTKTIFGKTVAVKVIVQCNLIISGSNYYINCVAKLQYTIFNNVKTITIYSFTKKINISWTWNNTYSGSWSQTIAIPLPPPVSFITINLNFAINYWISINLSAKPIYFGYPFRYKAQAIIQTGLDTYASAGVRVVLVEGGVFLQGTLVKVGTDPSVTLSFFWWSKRINVLVSWYFWLHAFNYKWGFYWKYWSPFSWKGPFTIASWTISNGYYQKWQILYKSWNIYY